jgi:DNA-binding LacI/PurR family transcriptional regulator
MGKRPTIYDVAERAGVSISTVSFALNKPDRVSDESRRLVLAAADELGFVPKAEAVSRARRGVGRIGVIAPFTSYPSYFRRLAGILGDEAAKSFDICVYDEASAATLASPLLSALPISDRLDGLIVMGRQLEDKVTDRLLRQSLPTVMVDAESKVFSTVITDDAAGGALVAEYLVSKGHRKIAFLREPILTSEPLLHELGGWRRFEAFRDALRAAGRREDELSVHEVVPTLENTRAAVREILTREPRPTAFFAHDALAVGALLAARDLGLRVPEDIAVMGFDDGDLAVAADLTTVRQPFEESGRMAMRTLSVHMSDPDYTRHTILLDLKVVERSTV